MRFGCRSQNHTPRPAGTWRASSASLAGSRSTVYSRLLKNWLFLKIDVFLWVKNVSLPPERRLEANLMPRFFLEIFYF